MFKAHGTVLPMINVDLNTSSLTLQPFNANLHRTTLWACQSIPNLRHLFNYSFDRSFPHDSRRCSLASLLQLSSQLSPSFVRKSSPHSTRSPLLFNATRNRRLRGKMKVRYTLSMDFYSSVSRLDYFCCRNILESAEKFGLDYIRGSL